MDNEDIRHLLEEYVAEDKMSREAACKLEKQIIQILDKNIRRIEKKKNKGIHSDKTILLMSYVILSSRINLRGESLGGKQR